MIVVVSYLISCLFILDFTVSVTYISIIFMEADGSKSISRKGTTHANGGANDSCADDELDPWTAWAYRPRTITLLFMGACFLM